MTSQFEQVDQNQMGVIEEKTDIPQKQPEQPVYQTKPVEEHKEEQEEIQQQIQQQPIYQSRHVNKKLIIILIIVIICIICVVIIYRNKEKFVKFAMKNGGTSFQQLLKNKKGENVAQTVVTDKDGQIIFKDNIIPEQGVLI